MDDPWADREPRWRARLLLLPLAWLPIGSDALPNDDESDDDDAMECRAGRRGLEERLETFKEEGAINLVVDGEGGSRSGLGA